MIKSYFIGVALSILAVTVLPVYADVINVYDDYAILQVVTEESELDWVTNPAASKDLFDSNDINLETTFGADANQDGATNPILAKPGCWADTSCQKQENHPETQIAGYIWECRGAGGRCYWLAIEDLPEIASNMTHGSPAGGDADWRGIIRLNNGIY